ncbi:MULTISPECIES: nucleotidyltransferase family protein [unclassified Luteococcus]|uniref:nucleotidyltransferase family protein n=1 Tax=unclassified Luteococcus TaxID=2639923 RepID=UPI00313BBE92
MGHVTAPGDQLACLRADADSGVLAGLCERLGVGLLVVFGSVLVRPESAEDLDVACAASDGSRLDRMRILEALEERYGVGLDLMPLDQAGPVARYAALGPGELLYESEPGGFARAQMAAFGIYRDTQRMRDHQLEVLLG